MLWEKRKRGGRGWRINKVKGKEGDENESRPQSQKKNTTNTARIDWAPAAKMGKDMTNCRAGWEGAKVGPAATASEGARGFYPAAPRRRTVARPRKSNSRGLQIMTRFARPICHLPSREPKKGVDGPRLATWRAAERCRANGGQHPMWRTKLLSHQTGGRVTGRRQQAEWDIGQACWDQSGCSASHPRAAENANAQAV